MKKMIYCTAFLLTLTITGALSAQDSSDEPAPGRSVTGRSPLQKSIAVGLLASYNLSVNQDVEGGGSTSQELNHDYYGLSGRFLPLLGGKLGAGIDMILLHIGDDANLWQFDVDILLRLPLGKKLTANAGLGYSQYVISFKNGDDPWTSDLGYNLKLGAEYFLSRNLSLSGEFKWTWWEYVDGSSQTVTDTFLSFQIGLHYWL